MNWLPLPVKRINELFCGLVRWGGSGLLHWDLFVAVASFQLFVDFGAIPRILLFEARSSLLCVFVDGLSRVGSLFGVAELPCGLGILVVQIRTALICRRFVHSDRPRRRGRFEATRALCLFIVMQLGPASVERIFMLFVLVDQDVILRHG